MQEQVTITSSLALRVRLVRPADKQKLREGFEHLSSESRRRRFLGHKSQLSEAELRFFTDVDGINHVALTAFKVNRQGNEGKCVGVARFVRTPEDWTVAEIALVVADAYQRLGIGRLLLQRLLAAAAVRGVRRVQFYSLADNDALRRLIKRVAETATLHSEGGVMMGEFDVPPADPAAVAALDSSRPQGECSLRPSLPNHGSCRRPSIPT
jgi:GNAT superfamily N-acetyltransferase